MIDTLYIIIGSGLLAILYGYIVGRQVISSSPGNSKMVEIASAIQEGARAYLKRQYKTITLVGIIILIIGLLLIILIIIIILNISFIIILIILVIIIRLLIIILMVLLIISIRISIFYYYSYYDS